MTKRRITLTVDEDLLREAGAAVSAGEASSVSAWVNEAMADKSEHRRRLRALGEAIADYESEFGPITDDEVEQARQRASQRTIRVRARTQELMPMACRRWAC
ncbi:hypothetical protein [Candidatus Poriferisodalis sp.]|uniref:hypothetical protein n=1 Tax=Candidatus Poriferisodalis sp. TaxID=3101277 RepID=UPI003B02AA70